MIEFQANSVYNTIHSLTYVPLLLSECPPVFYSPSFFDDWNIFSFLLDSVVYNNVTDEVSSVTL